MRYQINSNSKTYDKSSNKSTFVFIIAIIVIALLISGIILLVKQNPFNSNANQKKYNMKLFANKEYVDLVKKLDIELKKNPFNVENLLYEGYCYLLLGEDEKNIERRKKYFSLSLSSLRKAMAIGVYDKNELNLFFSIGKIYYYMGDAYYKIAINYLEKSLKLGNKRKDLFYILGLTYSNIGKYEDAIKYYNESLKIEDDVLVTLAIGITYSKNNDFNNAKKFIEKVINTTNEPKIKEKSLFIMGQILFDQQQFNESEKYFQKVIEMNENSANAFFYLGEIFLSYGDKVKARSYWRKTLDIDPSHIRALKRIYN